MMLYDSAVVSLQLIALFFFLFLSYTTFHFILFNCIIWIVKHKSNLNVVVVSDVPEEFEFSGNNCIIKHFNLEKA